VELEPLAPEPLFPCFPFCLVVLPELPPEDPLPEDPLPIDPLPEDPLPDWPLPEDPLPD